MGSQEHSLMALIAFLSCHSVLKILLWLLVVFLIKKKTLYILGKLQDYVQWYREYQLLLLTLWSLRHILKFTLFWLLSLNLVSQAAMHTSLRLQSEQKLLVYMRTQKAQGVYMPGEKNNTVQLCSTQGTSLIKVLQSICLIF